jgi:hypothetical protein
VQVRAPTEPNEERQPAKETTVDQPMAAERAATADFTWSADPMQLAGQAADGLAGIPHAQFSPRVPGRQAAQAQPWRQLAGLGSRRGRPAMTAH